MPVHAAGGARRSSHGRHEELLPAALLSNRRPRRLRPQLGPVRCTFSRPPTARRHRHDLIPTACTPARTHARTALRACTRPHPTLRSLAPPPPLHLPACLPALDKGSPPDPLSQPRTHSRASPRFAGMNRSARCPPPAASRQPQHPSAVPIRVSNGKLPE